MPTYVGFRLITVNVKMNKSLNVYQLVNWYKKYKKITLPKEVVDVLREQIKSDKYKVDNAWVYYRKVAWMMWCEYNSTREVKKCIEFKKGTEDRGGVSSIADILKGMIK